MGTAEHCGDGDGVGKTTWGDEAGLEIRRAGMWTNVRGEGGCVVTTPTPCKTLSQTKLI